MESAKSLYMLKLEASIFTEESDDGWYAGCDDEGLYEYGIDEQQAADHLFRAIRIKADALFGE